MDPEAYKDMLAEPSPLLLETSEEATLISLCLSRGNSQNDCQLSAEVGSQARLIASDETIAPLELQEVSAPDSNSAYNVALRDLRFDLFDFPDIDAESTGQEGLNTARVAKELKTLSRDLPCEGTAAVYVRQATGSMGYFRVLISGTKDSPYAYGLYEFDVTLPTDYPHDPPKMQILTTGQGRVRFNPNLYADGYLCLSILNTWNSSPEEMWNPSQSTLLQVFVSIQSLIMDENVLQKEPGYEDYCTDSFENTLYRDIVRYSNMKWAMTNMIKNPPPEFEEVVKRHFLLLKADIRQIGQKWVEETVEDTPEDPEGLISSHNSDILGDFCARGRRVCMREAYEELVSVLEQLA